MVDFKNVCTKLAGLKNIANDKQSGFISKCEVDQTIQNSATGAASLQSPIGCQGDANIDQCVADKIKGQTAVNNIVTQVNNNSNTTSNSSPSSLLPSTSKDSAGWFVKIQYSGSYGGMKPHESDEPNPIRLHKYIGLSLKGGYSCFNGVFKPYALLGYEYLHDGYGPQYEGDGQYGKVEISGDASFLTLGLGMDFSIKLPESWSLIPGVVVQFPILLGLEADMGPAEAGGFKEYGNPAAIDVGASLALHYEISEMLGFEFGLNAGWRQLEWQSPEENGFKVSYEASDWYIGAQMALSIGSGGH